MIDDEGADNENTVAVLHEILMESRRQHQLWGEQNHPDGTSANLQGIAQIKKLICQNAARRDKVTWMNILEEEVWEAFAEPDPVALRAELVQVAAVAMSWIKAIDRRTDRRTDG